MTAAGSALRNAAPRFPTRRSVRRAGCQRRRRRKLLPQAPPDVGPPLFRWGARWWRRRWGAPPASPTMFLMFSDDAGHEPHDDAGARIGTGDDGLVGVGGMGGAGRGGGRVAEAAPRRRGGRGGAPAWGRAGCVRRQRPRDAGVAVGHGTASILCCGVWLVGTVGVSHRSGGASRVRNPFVLIVVSFFFSN